MFDSRPLGDAVDAAIGAMKLTPADDAAVALARFYAKAMEDAEDKQKAAYLGPHLLNTLDALGGTPKARKSLGVVVEKLSAVDELKKKRESRAA